MISPVIRYGWSFGISVIIVIIAFTILDGAVRWIALAIAVLYFVIFPQILKWTVENSTEVE